MLTKNPWLWIDVHILILLLKSDLNSCTLVIVNVLESLVIIMEITLSDRLFAVYQYIPQGSILADIGSDHAYLPIYAVYHGRVEKAIAGEVAEGPFQTAVSRVKEAGLSSQIDVRKGDGMSVMQFPGEANCITIAGMGGPLIMSILQRGKAKLQGVKRLILQPNVASYPVRKWLISNGWQIEAETILEEAGHIYEVIVADKENKPKELTEKELFFGPYLLKEKNAVFRKKWEREKQEWERIYRQLEKAERKEATEGKKKQLQQYMDWYKEEFGE